MSPWELVGRARKVAKMAARVPTGRTAGEVAALADHFAALALADRERLAAAAGVKPPSETTWTELVAALRARRPLGELLKDSNEALGASRAARTAHRGRSTHSDARAQRWPRLQTREGDHR